MRKPKQILDNHLRSGNEIYGFQVADKSIPFIISAMEEYAKEYHKTKILKLNKSDVISSVCEHDLKYRWMSDGSKLCEECGEEF